ncbi:MAG: TM2 domain-containing protein [Chthoniobacteraceae bacterium]|jgi:hypothetical protein
MSRKRVLPALILAGYVGFLGLHRLYAGRYITGLVQLGLFVPGALMIWPVLAKLESLQTIGQLVDWSANNQLPPVPVLMVSVSTIWALFDCILLAGGKFKDGAGDQMTRWI